MIRTDSTILAKLGGELRTTRTIGGVALSIGGDGERSANRITLLPEEMRELIALFTAILDTLEVDLGVEP